MTKSLNILVDNLGIIEEFEGRLVPRTILRKIRDAKDVETAFRKILSHAKEGNPIASILLTITAKPGISIYDLYEEVKKRNSNISRTALEDIVNQLANQGLLHTSRPFFGSQEFVKLYSFSHIPHLLSDEKEMNNQINSVIKGLEPSLLSTINIMFPSIEERELVYGVFKGLLAKKELSFDDIDSEHGGKFGRKILTIANSFPFIKIDKDFSHMSLDKTRMGELMVDVIQYSLLAGNQALGEYSQAISDVIIKDKQINLDVSNFRDEFLKLKV